MLKSHFDVHKNKANGAFKIFYDFYLKWRPIASMELNAEKWLTKLLADNTHVVITNVLVRKCLLSIQLIN